MNYYEFECGCKFKQFGEEIKPEDGLPPIEIDYYNINHDCQLAWQILLEGKTKGVFQLEKSLGKHWSKLCQPTSVEDIAALISIIRPGVLKAMLGKKSMTQHFADRKSGLEPVTYIHEAVEEILAPTQGVLVYQEQSMAIASKLAGFDLQQADTLRKAIGKKKADLMAKVKTEFVDGCNKTGIVNEEIARSVFDDIEKSNRYAFNKSHAVEYGEIGYWTAYAKAHFPLHFFAAFLEMSNDKTASQEEVSELVEDAKLFGINVYPPRIQERFSIVPGGVFFGLKNVKNVGCNHIVKLLERIRLCQQELDCRIEDWPWHTILTNIGDNTNKTVFNNLISVGVFIKTGLSRQVMLHQYNMWSKLTSREKEMCKDIQDINECIIYLINKCKISRPRMEKLAGIIQSLENPPFKTEDTPYWITNIEQEILGTPITCTKVDNINSSAANTTCKEFLDGKDGEVSLAVEISGVREYIAKNGKPMAFLNLRDNSGSLDATVFNDLWSKSKNLCYKGNTCLVVGNRSDRGGMIVKKIKEL